MGTTFEDSQSSIFLPLIFCYPPPRSPSFTTKPSHTTQPSHTTPAHTPTPSTYPPKPIYSHVCLTTSPCRAAPSPRHTGAEKFPCSRNIRISFFCESKMRSSFSRHSERSTCGVGRQVRIQQH